MAKGTRINMGWSKEFEDGSEEDFTLTVLVTPGDDGRHGEPHEWSEPDPGDVEVLEVREYASGLLRPDLLDEAQESIDCAEAMERAGDAHEAAREAFWEFQEDARRERRAEERRERAERLDAVLWDIARR